MNLRSRCRSSVLVLVVAIWTISTTLLPACRTGGGSGGVVSKVVDCARQALRERGLTYVGKVNAIIGSTELGDTEVRNRLVNLGIDAGQDVLGCLLFDQGARFAESAQRNPDDAISNAAARRAREHIKELEREGWQFKPVEGRGP